MIIKRFKKGIALIELIFAIVIIGIVLLSTPMLIQQSINSGYVALQQEAIAAISSHTEILLSKHWDEEDANNTTGVAPIIQLQNPQPNSPFQLSGIIDVNLSSRTSAVGENNLTASLIGVDFNETSPDLFDDIDDYNNRDLNLTIFNGEATTASIGEYVDQDIIIHTDITFADDRPLVAGALSGTTINAGNNIFTTPDLGLSGGVPIDSNIKFVKVKLTSANTDIPELNKSITLNAFSCNLGTYTLGDNK